MFSGSHLPHSGVTVRPDTFFDKQLLQHHLSIQRTQSFIKRIRIGRIGAKGKAHCEDQDVDGWSDVYEMKGNNNKHPQYIARRWERITETITQSK